MEELVVQSDGTYAVCFKNFSKIGMEEVENIFNKFGNIVSIRQSSEAIPWVFIRYKDKEEAQKALDDLQGYKDFDIRPAKSYQKKKQDQFGDREKSDSFSEGLRDNKSIKGVHNRNRGSEKFIMDSEDNDSYDTKRSSYIRRHNNFAERPFKNKEEGNFNHSDRMIDSEGARALSPNRDSMGYQKNQRSPNEKQVRGRESRVGVRGISENTRSVDGSPPRLVKKSGNLRLNGAIEVGKPEDGPPKLVKGSEFYANSRSIADSTTHGLALLAAREEVWENHPLHSEMALKEIIIANFEYMPSKKDIYELCLPVKPLHVSFGTTPAGSFYSRVLVASEKEFEQLLMLNSNEELCFTTLEELLDEIFFSEDGE